MWVHRSYARLYLWAARRLYNELAFLYDPVSWLVSRGRWAGWRRLALDYVRGPRVLEVGFGTGELLMTMAGRSVDVFGLEASGAMHALTARKLRQRGLSVGRVRGEVQALPFSCGCFDSIVSTFPAEYIVDTRALGEIARVLRGADAATAGRLVVVGVVVYPARLGTIAPPALRPPPDPAMERFVAILESAGLWVALCSRYDHGARVPVVLAERCK